MEAGPFNFEEAEPTIIKRSALEKIIKQYGGRKKAKKKTDKKVEKKSETKAEE